MKINCAEAGKRYNRDWIFRNFTYQFTTPGSYAITGPNGSGKSTLLQVIAGSIVTSEGNIQYERDNRYLEADDVYSLISIAAPYLEVVEEMTLTEFLQFHQIFKPFLQNMKPAAIISLMGLQHSAHRQIRYYSSGMKQRVKLAQAIFSDTPCLLLDEPCTNLDEPGIRMYHTLMNDYAGNRLVVISSNDFQEYSFCDQVLNMADLKT